MSDEKIISEVTVRPIRPQDGLVAFASLVIETILGKFFIGSIGVYTKKAGGYRITYPNKKAGNSEMQIFNPVSKELQEAIEASVIGEYETLITEGM